jgi:hypothetical protein
MIAQPKTDCPYFDRGTCQIAAQIHPDHQPTPIPAAVCEACSTSPHPRQVNMHTIAIVHRGLRQSDPKRAAEFRKKHAPLLRSEMAEVNELARWRRNRAALAGHTVKIITWEERVAAVEAGKGPGSQLWNLLRDDFGVEHTADCPCLGTAEWMNRIGPDGCREQRAECVKKIKEGKAKVFGRWRDYINAAATGARRGAVRYVKITDPIGSVVDEAIRRADVALAE